MLYLYFSLGRSIKPVICLTVFAFSFAPVINAQKPAAINKPNIIFILGDDVGYDVLRINGGQSYSTPNLDSMARHGMNFTHCEASPLCATSRHLLLTGKHHFRNYSSWGYMNENEKTIANVMQDGGYATGFFGKLQLQYNYTTMRNWGWDYDIVFEATEDTMTYRRYKNPVLRRNGYRIPDSVTANKYCDDILTNNIFNFIDSNRTRPFFVYYSMSIGHDPYSPTPDDPEFAGWDPKSKKSDTAFFSSMMRYMDKKIGLILRWLRTKGLDKNTMVVFAGDNGIQPVIYFNANGVQNIKGEKGSSTEGGTHVPLIAYWPGHIQKGSRNDDLIDFVDFLPTFAEAAQVTDLSKCGILDGQSFYPTLLQQPHTAKQQLFCHFDHHPGFSKLQRWVRDKVYKLYDSTDKSVWKSGKFFNIVKDKKELYPLDDSVLTSAEKQIKQRFQNILDTIGTWPQAPVIKSQFADSIRNTSARVTATIISTGASELIDRGSTLTAGVDQKPYLHYNRMHDSVATTGTFSHKRTGLLPQTSYRYSLYAMNNNNSHSTSFAVDSFYTLSNPVLLQPEFFTDSVNSGIVYLNWGNAQFPANGAKNAGYLLVYSRDSIRLLKNPNGKSPDSIVAHGHIISTVSTVLPNLPAVTANKAGLTPGTYKFRLIPYTWNGSKAATYNYFTKNALTTTATIQQLVLNNAVTTIPGKTELTVSFGKPAIYPDPSTGNINISYAHNTGGEAQIKVFDMAGKPVFTKTVVAIKGNNICSLDLSALKPGIYCLGLADGGEQNCVKFIIQK